MQIFVYCKISLHVSGVHRTHHQEYIKLQRQPLVQVIVSEQQPSSNVAYRPPSSLSDIEYIHNIKQ